MINRVDVQKYLTILRDPVDGGYLELVEGDPPKLKGITSGLHYGYQGEFPDLRPDAGYLPSMTDNRIVQFDGRTAASHNRVLEHYDEKPCHNYLSLDNVPLGKYLRDSHYDVFFKDIDFIVEVGSGKGAIATEFKQHRGVTPFCIDIAYGSLRHVRTESLNADGLLASNLALPLAGCIADMVISYGVIHHTPNPLLALRELARILKPGGRLLLNVYNWENLYRSLYFFFSPPLKSVRHFFGHRIGDYILKGTVFLPYYLSLWLVLGIVQKRWEFPNLHASYEQFGDFFLTPIAHFYHTGELVTMGEAVGLNIIEHETGGWPQDSFAHFIWYEKKQLQ